MDDKEEETNVVQLNPQKEGGEKKKGFTGNQRTTDKQRRFAFLVGHEGLSLSAAYREAYDVQNMKDTTIWQEACMLAKNPKVSKLIKEYQQQKEERAYYDGKYVRQAIAAKLIQLMNSAEKESDQIKAAEMLGKLNHVQAFTDKIKVEDDTDGLSSTELLERLQERLKSLAS